MPDTRTTSPEPSHDDTDQADQAGSDVVAVSVAAYSEHIEDYQAANRDLMAAAVDRFCAQLTPADDVILDAGCGPGRDLLRFAERGHCAVGVDLNVEFLDAAATLLEGWPVHLRTADLRALPFDTDSFAGTWACASLVHLPEPDTQTALAELARVTRPGGPVYVSVKRGERSGWANTPHGRRWFTRWTPARFAAAATRAGLRVEAVDANEVFVDLWCRA